MSKPVYIAIASPKGGVGKTTLTVLAASCLHYHQVASVTVIDCNAPVHSLAYLRRKETAEIERAGNEYRKEAHHRIRYHKEPYPIVCSDVRKALADAEKICSDTKRTDCIFFDLPSLMSMEGTVELLAQMDAVIFPLTGSPLDTETLHRFIEVLGEQVVTMGKGNIKRLYLLRSMVSQSDTETSAESIRALSDDTGAVLMRTFFPLSRQYREFLRAGKAVGVSTLLPPGRLMHRIPAISFSRELNEILSAIC